MINKGYLQELYKQGFTYQGKQDRKKKYERLFTICAKCGDKPEVLHHIDFNNQNDEESNLQPLCHNCHIEAHEGTHRRPANRLAKSRAKNPNLTPYRPTLIRLTEEQAENLRNLSHIRRESQSKIIRDLFDDFYMKPKDLK